jgi:hypothetical protein
MDVNYVLKNFDIYIFVPLVLFAHIVIVSILHFLHFLDCDQNTLKIIVVKINRSLISFIEMLHLLAHIAFSSLTKTYRPFVKIFFDDSPEPEVTQNEVPNWFAIKQIFLLNIHVDEFQPVENTNTELKTMSKVSVIEVDGTICTRETSLHIELDVITPTYNIEAKVCNNFWTHTQ